MTPTSHPLIHAGIICYALPSMPMTRIASLWILSNSVCCVDDTFDTHIYTFGVYIIISLSLCRRAKTKHSAYAIELMVFPIPDTQRELQNLSYEPGAIQRSTRAFGLVKLLVLDTLYHAKLIGCEHQRLIDYHYFHLELHYRSLPTGGYIILIYSL